MIINHADDEKEDGSPINKEFNQHKHKSNTKTIRLAITLFLPIMLFLCGFFAYIHWSSFMSLFHPPEVSVLPEELKNVRLDMTFDKLNSIRFPTKLEQTECSSNFTFSHCANESVKGMVFNSVTYCFAEIDDHDELKAYLIDYMLDDYKLGDFQNLLKGHSIQLGDNYHVQYVETMLSRGTHIYWKKGNTVIHLSMSIMDTRGFSKILGGSPITDPIPLVALEIGHIEYIDTAVGQQAIESASIFEVENLYSDILATNRLANHLLNSEWLSNSDCNSILNFNKNIPISFCEPLVHAANNGRTTSTGRLAIRNYLKRNGYRKFNGYIVAQIETGIYEIAQTYYNSWWGWLPSNKTHMLLRTYRTSYSTKGTFSLWVQSAGSMDIETKDGFNQDWDIIEETPFGTMIQDVFDAPAGKPTKEAARLALASLLF